MDEITRLKFKQEVISTLLTSLADKLRDLLYSYEVVGKEDKQALDWRTQEPLWVDDEKTIPVYRDKFDWVAKQTFTDEEKAKIDIITEIGKKIPKL